MPSTRSIGSSSSCPAFCPTSALSLLNAAGALNAPPELVEVTTLALDARERTGGRFDPTVHNAVVAAGYDRSFDEIRSDGAPISPGAACGGRVAVNGSTIEIEPGYRLDLGGIAKGYAADRACALLAEAGPCIVNAGGDLASHDTPRRASGPWPSRCRALRSLSGSGAARSPRQAGITGAGAGVASSSTISSIRQRACRHEPRSVRVTAFAPTAAEAEVIAKALLLAGERAARIEADALGVPAVLVTDDERVVLAGGLS